MEKLLEPTLLAIFLRSPIASSSIHPAMNLALIAKTAKTAEIYGPLPCCRQKTPTLVAGVSSCLIRGCPGGRVGARCS